MSSPATSRKIGFVELSGNPIDGPREWTPALVRIDIDPAYWETARLTIQGQSCPMSLRRLNGRTQVVAEWPRSGPGRYSIRATWEHGSDECRIAIPPAKLSESSFATLLADLETHLPAAIAFGLQRLGGLSGLNILPPAETTIAHELTRLKRAMYGTELRLGLTQVLLALAPDPHRVLRVDDVWTRSERARRLHPARLPQVVVHPHNIGQERSPVRVVDQRVEPSVDVYENRLLGLFYEQVRLRLRRLARQVELSSSESVRADVRQMMAKLRGARQQAGFLDEVVLIPHLPTQISMVLLKRPPYRAALEGFLELHRSLAVRLEEPGLDAPLDDLPHLYQLWGTMQVIATLLEVAAQHGYKLTRQRLVQRDATGAFVRILPGGHPTLHLTHPDLGTEIRLYPERSFGNAGGLRSISYIQIPDITIEIAQTGSAPRLYLFDPKYKLASELADPAGTEGKPTKVDIDKMHAYRDAIRDNNMQRVVESSAILFPGPSVIYAPGIEALQAYPGSSASLTQRLGEILDAAVSSEDDQ